MLTRGTGRSAGQCDVGAVGPAADLGCLVRGEVIQDDEQPVAVRAGGADGLERGEHVAGAFVFPGDAPELVGAQGIAAVEVASAQVRAVPTGGLKTVGSTYVWFEPNTCHHQRRRLGHARPPTPEPCMTCPRAALLLTRLALDK